MDVSVLNLKNNAVLTAGVNALGTAVSKSETKAASDVFLDMMKQAGTTASFSSESKLEAGFIKAAQTQTLKSADKKPAFEKTAAKKSDFGFETSAPRDTKETNVVEKDTKPAVSEKTDKPDLSADKNQSAVGQKIPCEEKDSADTVENGVFTAKTDVLQTNAEEVIIGDTEVADEFVVKSDKTPQETQGDVSIEKSSPELLAAAVQQTVIQKVPEQVKVVDTKSVDTIENVEKAVLPEEVAADFTPIETNQVKQAVQENDGFVPQAAETQANVVENVKLPENAGKKEVVETAQTKTTAPVETVETDFSSDVKQSADEAPVENKYAVATTGRHTDTTANVQAQKIAADLSNGTKLNIQVETAVEETAGVAQNTTPRFVQTQEEQDNAVESTTLSKTAESRPAAHYDIASAVKNGQNAQNDFTDLNENAQTRADTVNVLANAPNNASAQTFSNALKSSSAIEGVSATQTASVKGDASLQAPMSNVSFKAKTDGSAATNAPAAKPNVPTNDLVDQIKVNIAKAAKSGLEKVTVTLKPKELGNIQVSLEIGDDGELKATIIASRASTLDMLQKDSSSLQKALSDAGFKLNDNSLNFSYRGEQQNNAQQFAQGGSERHQSAQSNSFANVSDAIVAETEQADLTEAIIASQWSAGRHALNIRI